MEVYQGGEGVGDAGGRGGKIGRSYECEGVRDRSSVAVAEGWRAKMEGCLRSVSSIAYMLCNEPDIAYQTYCRLKRNIRYSPAHLDIRICDLQSV